MHPQTNCQHKAFGHQTTAGTLRLLWRHLGRHCKVFHLQDIESNKGKLGHIVSTAPWLCFLLPNHYADITTCLKIHHNHLYMMNKQFCALLKLQCDCNVPHNHGTFAMAKTAKATHLLRQHFISKRLSSLMDLIILILHDDLVSWHCPIAHLIPPDPSAIAYLDSLSHVVGGYSTDLQFCWHLQWLDSIQARVAKARTGDTISINALEYTFIIINYVTTTAAILSAPLNHDPYQTALFFTNNVASKAWIHKGAKQLPAGKALGILQCTLMINNPVGINVDCVSTTSNVIAVCISQFPNHNDPLPHFLDLSQAFPQLQQCRHFHPSAELVSTILDVLLLVKLPDPREPSLSVKTCLAWQEHFLAF